MINGASHTIWQSLPLNTLPPPNTSKPVTVTSMIPSMALDVSLEVNVITGGFDDALPNLLTATTLKSYSVYGLIGMLKFSSLVVPTSWYGNP